MFVSLPALADGNHCKIHWEKLNLSPQQSQQIQALEQQWKHTYDELAPVIADEQQLLTKKLGQHCDQLEIITLHNSIDTKQRQLRNMAMMTVLKKKAVLNEDQRRSLEDMWHQEIVKHQQENNQLPKDGTPEGIQDLWNRANHVIPAGGGDQR
jgi:hypothetical protein